MSKSSEKAYAAIRDMILDGAVKPGEHLSEEHLSAAIGVSRTPVRDALRRLEADYFVSIKANRGARVRGWNSEDVDDLFQLRALLEGFAVRLAAERSTPGHVAELRLQIDAIDRALSAKPEPDIEKFLRANGRFHQIICEASGNSRLSDMIATLVAQAVVVRTANVYSKKDLERSNAHHREMTDAIEAHDAGLAELVMRTHILTAGKAFRNGAALRDGLARQAASPGRRRIDRAEVDD